MLPGRSKAWLARVLVVFCFFTLFVCLDVVAWFFARVGHKCKRNCFLFPRETLETAKDLAHRKIHNTYTDTRVRYTLDTHHTDKMHIDTQ